MRENSSEYLKGVDAGYLRAESAIITEYENRAYNIWKRCHCEYGWDSSYDGVLAEMLGVSSYDMVKEFDRRRCNELENNKREYELYLRNKKEKKYGTK